MPEDLVVIESHEGASADIEIEAAAVGGGKAVHPGPGEVPQDMVEKKGTAAAVHGSGNLLVPVDGPDPGLPVGAGEVLPPFYPHSSRRDGGGGHVGAQPDEGLPGGGPLGESLTRGGVE